MTIASEQPDSRKYLRALTALIWLALPIMAVMYAMSWRELPPRLATHFDLANQPNGWMSREASLMFSLVFALIMVMTATWILSRVRKPDPTAWALLGLFYVILGTLLLAVDSVIAYNISGRRLDVTPVLVTGMGAAILVVIVALATRRGAELPRAGAFAEETHANGVLGLLLFAASVAISMVAYSTSLIGARIVVAIPAILAVASAAVAFSGFRYLFTPAGVEIRTLGFRLRSIPSADIQSYAIDRWNVLGGYGIRGVGDKRAYVWGNRGVLIKTTEGEVFLGHDDPEKVVRDLDRITRNHEARASHGS